MIFKKLSNDGMYEYLWQSGVDERILSKLNRKKMIDYYRKNKSNLSGAMRDVT